MRLNGPFPFPLWEIKVLLIAVFLFSLVLYEMIFDDLSSCPIHAEMLLHQWGLDHYCSAPHPPDQSSSAAECQIESLTLTGYTNCQCTMSLEEVKSSFCTNYWIPTLPPKSTYSHIWWQLCAHPAVLKNEWVIYAWVLYHDVCDDMFGIADHLMFSEWVYLWLRCVVLSSRCARRETWIPSVAQITLEEPCYRVETLLVFHHFCKWFQEVCIMTLLWQSWPKYKEMDLNSAHAAVHRDETYYWWRAVTNLISQDRQSSLL